MLLTHPCIFFLKSNLTKKKYDILDAFIDNIVFYIYDIIWNLKYKCLFTQRVKLKIKYNILLTNKKLTDKLMFKIINLIIVGII